MTDQNAQEPTMEEILASIRRIISEDDAPADTAAAPPAAEPAPEPVAVAFEAPAEPEPAPEPTPEPVFVEPEPAVEDDVLELTDRYEPPVAETIGDLDVSVSESFDEPAPYVAPEPAWSPEPAAETLVGESAAASAASAFAGLAASFRQSEEPAGTGPTIDALARELLRPMLKEWLDANLPAIVEAQVRKEVERIARNAG